MTIAIESTMLSHILDAHYAEPDEPSHRAVWIDLTLDHVGDSADVELARSGVWRGTLAEWLEVGPGIVRRVPLQRVELADREPEYDDADADWIREELAGKQSWFAYAYHDLPYTLPQCWFGKQDWYPYDTRELALADASRRAIAWARRTEVTP